MIVLYSSLACGVALVVSMVSKSRLFDHPCSPRVNPELIPDSRFSGSQETVDEHGTVNSSGAFSKHLPSYVNRDYKDPAVSEEAMIRELEKINDPKNKNVIQIGLVKVDKKSWSLSFPARLNMSSGNIEYALTTERGKTHESLLTTDASPMHIHAAALLLGIANLDGEANKKILIDIKWQPNGPMQVIALEKMIAMAKGVPIKGGSNDNDFNDSFQITELGETLTSGPWVYSGSEFRQGAFMAALDGSIIALINDPGALIQNPRPGNTNDRLHLPSKNIPPAEKFPVVVHIRAVSKTKHP